MDIYLTVYWKTKLIFLVLLRVLSALVVFLYFFIT
jgi:hypothetical protein